MSDYLFDTTAFLAHHLDERGADDVQQILNQRDARVLIASVSIAELARRLWTLGDGSAVARGTALTYVELCDAVVPVDVAVSVRAYELATIATDRIPLIDTLIAAAAQVSAATLVHRDRHFLSLSAVPQLEIGTPSR